MNTKNSKDSKLKGIISEASHDAADDFLRKHGINPENGEDLDSVDHSKDKGIRGQLGKHDKKRSGTWMEQHHIDAAASNLARTKAFYNAARNATTIWDEEKYLARVFQDKSIADTFPMKFFQRELASNTTQFDFWDDVSDETASDFHGDESKRLYIRDDGRTPEEIIEVDEIIQLLYHELDTVDYPPLGKPHSADREKSKMCLTYYIVRGRFDHLLFNNIPYWKEINDILTKIEKDGKDPDTAQNFITYSGIPKSRYQNTAKFLLDRTAHHGVDFSGFTEK